MTLSHSHIHQLSSETIGHEFRISVALPNPSRQRLRGIDPGGPFPVLYVLDPDDLFPITAHTARWMSLLDDVPDLIVVGVGYPTDDDLEILRLRHRDYTPTSSLPGNQALEDIFPETRGLFTSGGGPQFLRFLLDEVHPWVVSQFAAHPDQSAIFGHSLGGLFVIQTLLHLPEAFTGYIAGSPSLWWDDFVTFDDEERFASSYSDLPVRLYMGVGSREEEPDFPMVSNVIQLDARFQDRQYQGFEYMAEVLRDETHLSVTPGLLSRGLRFIYGTTESGNGIQ